MIFCGLTGGIGSGKSTVSGLLAERGAVVIDADALTRELQQAGQPVFDAIVSHFGPAVVGPDGQLDRPALAGQIFSDPEAKKALEAIVHPAVRAEMLKRVNSVAEDKVVVYDVALLVEASSGLAGRRFDAVVVVDVDPEVAVHRLVSYRSMSEQDVRARMANQVGREARLAVADRVIDNSGVLDDLDSQVEDVWQWLLTKAR
jgi:dephospho-CoA kinase